jgi:hypothetical protein
MSWLWWLPTVLLSSLSLLLIIGNPIAGYLANRRGVGYSFYPFVGGISGFIACWLSPWTQAHYFSWVPLLADITIPLFFYVLVFTDVFRPPKKNS